MKTLSKFLCQGTLASASMLAIAFSPSNFRPAVAAQFYQQTNLVSDGAVPAANTDPNLKNPWGISFSPTGPFWISDNGTGVTTLYNGAGVPQSLVVTIPSAAGSTATATPTGQVFNGTANFALSSGNPSSASRFIFATEDGTISGWNPSVSPTNAIIKVDKSTSGAVYKGLAIGSKGSNNFLYASNFNSGSIDVFDSNFQAAGSFTDPNTPAGFAPFNIQNIGGKLYVTYAKQDAAKHDDVAGAGNGFVDIFDPNSNSFTRLASGTAAGGTLTSLNSPWGLALAPANFGQFSNDLLVGNFGDGRINAFDPTTGNFIGQLDDSNGSTIAIDGLWGLAFGNGGNAGNSKELFFTAGINGEANGLFGKLQAQTVPEPTPLSLFSLALVPAIALLRPQKKSIS